MTLTGAIGEAVRASPDAARQIASLPYAVIMLRPGHRIAAVNGAGEQLLGQGARRLMGKALKSVIDFGETRLLAMMEDTDVQINARDMAARIGKSDARRLHVIVSPVAGWEGWQTLTLIEPAEVEALEEGGGDHQEAALRAPEILAHEIKNPLAGIRGAAQLLARKAKPADRALTSLIADEVDRIAALIDQMQSLSSRSTQPATPVNLHGAIRRARAVLEAGGHDGVRIREEFDPSLPKVFVSADALAQVLLNLLTNAAEACGESEKPTVTLHTRFASGILLRQAGDGAPIRLPIEIRVTDNGPGVDPALRDHIFEPFVSSKKQGQGLGLALVRKLVRDMNGRITHERDELRGLTHFRLRLPMVETRRRSATITTADKDPTGRENKA
ncbi:two-component system sensor histidine kinase NtrB [Croceicoccus mobilis]|uniref:histidine kinase n=1 Tax=Croceicoccus mobilis TaxID=1703339 RepID=A0A917DXB7_9SPHN|nr:ATP-binding protein [Croceicoccus mobilis]GGD75656.1 ATPase [Croceicoccus mobilis]